MSGRLLPFSMLGVWLANLATEGEACKRSSIVESYCISGPENTIENIVGEMESLLNLDDSAYAVKGCYKDAAARDLADSPITSNTMTREACGLHCYLQGYKYAGTQNSEECYCGNTYGRYGQQVEGCDLACRGDSSQTCGGEWVNFVTTAIMFRSIQGGCADGEFEMGHGCLDIVQPPFSSADTSTTCPLSATNPPNQGKATCQTMGGMGFYIHVGGQSTDWVSGTDAMCLSGSRNEVNYGNGGGCQIAGSIVECKLMLLANACDM